METFWTVTELLVVLIENWLIYDFYARFHNAERKRIWQKITFYVFVLFTSCIAVFIDTYTPFSGMLTFICAITIIIYGLLFLKGNFFSKFFLPIASFGLVFVINIFLSIGCSFIFKESEDVLFFEQTGVRFFCIITSKLLLFLITRAILNAFHKGVVMNRQEWIMMSGISFISLFIGITVVEIGFVSLNLLTLPYILCFLGVVCIDIFVFIMLLKITKQNQKITEISLLELQVSQQKKTLEHMDIMQNKIRQCNHDHLNHMLCLQKMLDEKNYNEVSDYLGSLIQKNPEVTTTNVQIPDHFLRVVLTVKLEQCKLKNIVVSLKTDDTTPSCESADLCILLSNLLDNAIEASTKVSEPKIEITLSKKKDYYTILVKNRIENSVLKNNASLKTTKKDKRLHGIGIQSIKEIVHRYHGMMEYYEKDGWFIANIWLRES